jgi:hypothetical protein
VADLESQLYLVLASRSAEGQLTLPRGGRVDTATVDQKLCQVDILRMPLYTGL